MKKVMARPSKYKPEYCDKLIEFFDTEPWEERKIPHYKAGKVVWNDIKILPVRIPTLRGYAKSIGVGISTIYDWLNDRHASYRKEFSDAFTHAKEIRKDWLIDVGLSGNAPPVSFKFVAVNMTDMRDKQSLEHGINEETMDLLRLVDGGKGKLPQKPKQKAETAD